MKYIFYDLETTGKDKDWSQIIQFAAIVVDENLEVLDSYESKCRLKTGLVPEPEALLVNNNKISELSSLNFSHYDLIKKIKSKFKSWSPAIFFGFNSIQFDEEILRKSFFKSLFDVYITQLEGNKRGDLLNVVRSASFFNEESIKTLTNNKGKKSFRLEDLTKANNMEHYAHDAMGDVLATIELAKIIKKKVPEVWEQSLSNCHKNEVENFLFENDFFLNFEYNFGRANFNFLTYICSHPKYKYPQCYDVSIDPKDLLNLNYTDLKKRIREKPTFLKSIQHNKHPSIFKISYAKSLKLLTQIDEKLYYERVSLIKQNVEFKERIKLILNEQFEEKEEIKSQVDVLAEESLYKGGFPSYKDKLLMKKFHEVSWEEKFNICDQFEDERFKYFAYKILYEEAPEMLPKLVFNNIHKTIANQILTLEDVNWFTLPKAYKQIDDLREKFKHENDEEKLKFLSEINEFLEKMQTIYEPATNL